jgi:predicted double-glycine peptidase
VKGLGRFFCFLLSLTCAALPISAWGEEYIFPCGSRSMYFICCYYGLYTTPEHLNELSGVTAEGRVSALGIRNALLALGFDAEAYTTTYADLLRVKGPLILHIQGEKESHFCILLEASEDELTVFNGRSERRYTRQEFVKLWRGFVLEAKRPAENSAGFPSKKCVGSNLGPKRASEVLTCRDPRKDLGVVLRVPDGSAEEFTFSLENTDQKPLVVTAVKKSCSCVELQDIVGKTVPPDSAVLLQGSFKAPPIQAVQKADIFVSVADPNVSPITLTVSANFVDPIMLSPERLDFGRVSRSAGIRYEELEVIRVYSLVNIAEIRLEATRSCLTPIWTDQGGIQVQFSPAGLLGPYEAQIALRSSEHGLIARVPVSASVHGDIEVLPKHVLFWIREEVFPRKKRILLRASKGTMLDALRLEYDYHQLAVTLSPTDHTNEMHADVSLADGLSLEKGEIVRSPVFFLLGDDSPEAVLEVTAVMP